MKDVSMSQKDPQIFFFFKDTQPTQQAFAGKDTVLR